MPLLARWQVRLEGVLRYAERSRARGRGYYMMDSPGNDLESIAGQVRLRQRGGGEREAKDVARPHPCCCPCSHWC